MLKSHPICIVIAGPSETEAQDQIHRANSCADLVEFRLDLFNDFNTQSIRELKRQTKLPVIFTLRHANHGGRFKGSESERFAILKALIEINPAYVDLEHDSHSDFFKLIPKEKLICSMHNFNATPEDLEAEFQMLQKHPAALYKIATRAVSSYDALRMLKLIKDKTEEGYKLVGVCLGEDGVPTRILGGIFGNKFTSAALEESHSIAIAPGHLTVQTLLETYHFQKLSHKTKLFGLFGDPVSASIGHKRHNQTFRNHDRDAVYVKMRIPKERLEGSLKLVQELGFSGLSVTMPHKERAMHHISACDTATRSIGASNTLVITHESIKAYNTDGKAALEALLEKTDVKGKHVVIVGAGGAAKAILYYLHGAGAKLTILNRDLQKAEELAHRYGGNAGSLMDFANVASKGYDILINCTCVGRDVDGAPIDCSHLLSNKVVMEVITIPEETKLVKAARDKNCTIVYGMEMYMKQGEEQMRLWLKSSQ